MTLAYLLIIAIAFAAVAVSLIQLVGEYLSDRQSTHDSEVADGIVRVLEKSYRDMDAAAMYSYACETCAANGGRVLILDGTGTVAVDSQSEYNGTLFYVSAVRDVLGGMQSARAVYGNRNAAGLGLLYSGARMSSLYASALTVGGETAGVAVYISDNSGIVESLRGIQNRVLLWLVLVALCTLLLTVFTAHMFTEPMSELSEGISRMTQGDLTTRIRVHGKDEFAQLASAFNTMTEQLERLDASRSEFVSNASHELKTPLSTMKIMVESIIYQDPFNKEKTLEFLGDINSEIDRLNSIVSDLLTLVGLDTEGMTMHVSTIRPRDIINEQVRRLGPLARENGITLTCSARDTIETTGDAEKLGQVIYNLIDNAIKYTPRGGKVNVELSHSGRRIFIRVKDTGIGIPADDIPHIFDRFYRVDKARSRVTGGTGLGLSIVRQIVKMHGGDITAESTVGSGSVFTVTLPVNAPDRKEMLP